MNNMNIFEIRHWLFVRIRIGLKSIKSNKRKKIVFGILLIILITILLISYFISLNRYDGFLHQLGFYSAYFLLCTFSISGMLLVFSDLFEARKIHNAFVRIGFYNHIREVPVLVYKNKFDDMLFEMQFDSPGVPIEDWERHKYNIENILNITISKIRIGDKMSDIKIWGIEGKNDLTPIFEWNKDCYTSCLQAGKSMHGFVQIPLHIYPHILIGGSTGSGKTWLLKVLLFQAIQLKYHVIIADFKGGIDFSYEWRKRTTFIDNKQNLNEVLKKIIDEINFRKELFKDAECSRFEDYNQLGELKLKRIIFACDEVAELFDTSGMDKAEKEEKKKIEGMIATIARLGRAFGVHLILATQRPDSDVISGQIKSNIPYRICGRADSILSKIILDNTDAALLIPDDIQGVFLNQKGELFKGYFLYDDKWEDAIDE